jgi:CheY-like chemotaxis protein
MQSAFAGKSGLYHVARAVYIGPARPGVGNNNMNSSGEKAAAGLAGRRIFVVEDEFLIRMLLEDMLADLGYEIADVAGRLDEASELAKTVECDLAILDVNLDGHDVYPVADLLAKRGVPFIFVTGYGGRGLPENYRSHLVLQKPFQLDDLKKMLARLAAG